MNLDEVMQHARAIIGARAALRPWHEAFDLDDARPTPIVVSDELAFEVAIGLYPAARLRRSETGLSALIATTEMLELGIDTRADRNEDAADEIAEAVAGRARWAVEIEAALDRVGKFAGRDPMTILHRIDPNDLAALEDDDPPEIDADDLPFPDNVHTAGRFVLHSRGAAPLRHSRPSTPRSGNQRAGTLNHTREG